MFAWIFCVFMLAVSIVISCMVFKEDINED